MKNTFPTKDILPHLIATVISLVILFIYFSPVLSGKELVQSDMLQVTGWLKEATDYTGKGEEILWSNSTFSGMPAWRGFSSNILIHIHTFVNSIFPVTVLLGFLSFIGFYLLLRAYKANAWISFAGGIAFAFSTFNIISLEAGHINKVFDMALMAPVLAGIVFTYRGKYWTGAGLTILATTWHIFYSHVQITYYLIIIIFFLIITELIVSFKNKELKKFFTASAILAACVIIAIAPNVSRLWTTAEYAKSTTRGGSELIAKQHEGGGLDKDYVFSWSNGKLETMTLFIPSLYGGSSHEELDQSSETYKTLIKNGVPKSQAKEYIQSMPLYWGDQPFTSGPVYFGALICFLFILGVILIKEPLKWWILIVSALSIMLSWGKNFEVLTDFFFYNIPLYNKFRSVTMILSIAQLTFPLLAFITLKKIVSIEFTKDKIIRGVKWAAGITGGIALIFAIFGGTFFNFESASDKQLPEWLVDSLREDRAANLRADALRSLLFVLIGATLIWAYVGGKIKENLLFIGLIAVILIDLWTVNKRYLGKDDFKDKKTYEKKVFALTSADDIILKDPDPYFRVLNLTRNPFSEAITSYYHKSIGGYSAIKLGRYQDLIEAHLSESNKAVLDMLNTKYVIVADKNTNQPTVQINPDAAGNAWFVNSYKIVDNADEELKSLKDFNPETTAYIDKRFAGHLKGLPSTQEVSGSISLSSYHPNRLTYKVKTSNEQLAVFSEIFYEPGWNVYLNGKPTDHIRANYVLRAMRVPAGEHVIEFKFEPRSYFIGEKISLIGSILLVASLLLVFGRALYIKIKENKETNS